MTEILLTSAQMKACDEHTINDLGVPSRTLMERAADALAKEILRSGADISRTVALCGSGNNGGDGYASLRFLAQYAREKGIDARICSYFAGNESAMTEGCALQRRLAAQAGVEELDAPITEGATLIIDALFGIGLSRPLSDEFKKLAEKVNSSGAYVVSADIPSGISADNGEIMGAAVKADLTVTFASYKRGHFVFPGAEYCGKLIKADIGIASDIAESKIFTAFSLPCPMPHRAPWSNKGSFGRVLVIGGAKNMAGAAYLSAKAAYRMGAGLVKIFTCEENRIILQTLLPEAVLSTYSEDDPPSAIEEKLAEAMKDSDSAVVGPGLSQSEGAKHLLSLALKKASSPLVIDADALNILASEPELWSFVPKNTVITPHMGEMQRLTGIAISELKRDPFAYSMSFAERMGVVCAMKDARTAVSDGERVYLNSSGCSALSKGGSGDVLTGMVAALLAVGKCPFDAACLAVYLHGRAGEEAAVTLTEYSLLAGDIADHIPAALKKEL